MVQFISTCICRSAVCNCQKDTYWKLGFFEPFTIRSANEYLENRGYPSRKRASKATALQAASRCQRQLLPYWLCNLQELRTFCESRSLEPKKNNFSGCVSALEQADDEATFDRFLQLPAELRNTIYEYHFSDMRTIPEIHRQPPITQVSSQLRKEAQPLFYNCCTFKMTIEPDFLPHTWEIDNRTWAKSIMHAPTETNLSLVKHLKIHIGDWTPVGSLDAFSVNFTPGLRSDEAITLYFTKPPQADEWHDTENDRADFTKDLFLIIQELLARDDHWSLRKNDIDRLRRTYHHRLGGIFDLLRGDDDEMQLAFGDLEIP
ncbi:hypothetical protein Q7P37_008849 [Cladosporium fusiforme]